MLLALNSLFSMHSEKGIILMYLFHHFLLVSNNICNKCHSFADVYLENNLQCFCVESPRCFSLNHLEAESKSNPLCATAD